jgi:hypothetical protein
MALTTGDLQQIKEIVVDATAHLATKNELKGLATKADLDHMEARLTTSMNLIERDAFTRLDQHELRIAKLEKAQVAT